LKLEKLLMRILPRLSKQSNRRSKERPQNCPLIFSTEGYADRRRALLKGMDERIRMETNLPVHVAEDPLTAVVRGAERPSRILINIPRYSFAKELTDVKIS